MRHVSRIIFSFAGCFIVIFALWACDKPSPQAVEIKQYPIDALDGIISQSGVQIDSVISKDGKGSLKISASEPTVIRLFETGDVDIEDASLIYRAQVRTEGVQGQVFLEMWCQFPGKGEFFSRSLQSPLSGTNEWTTVETPFFMQKGENPDNVKLNLVIDGTGTVWIDDIHLIKGPLQ